MRFVEVERHELIRLDPAAVDRRRELTTTERVGPMHAMGAAEIAVSCAAFLHWLR
ncbi:hypothetical protein RKE30_37820 [Streptomyces sp. Li-HN-5-11]|uniref:hypothetical protein n=1 Tax=Streptomyces sp. Li-HN-5-11 TaxID=3075432 RepID=UPI0028A87B44|nr:hypothetical protein [Streptomyces sp. Li-HN-5-11]WNM35711.1 hypothetical protein RKE30_37820 [Streptomyces sp. Li-HN-5-11]